MMIDTAKRIEVGGVIRPTVLLYQNFCSVSMIFYVMAVGGRMRQRAAPALVPPEALVQPVYGALGQATHSPVLSSHGPRVFRKTSSPLR
jgi:hypothetical protein